MNEEKELHNLEKHEYELQVKIRQLQVEIVETKRKINFLEDGLQDYMDRLNICEIQLNETINAKILIENRIKECTNA